MDKRELKYWIAWNKVKEIGPVRFARLWQNFPSLEEAWKQDLNKKELMKLLHIGEETYNKIETEKQNIDPEGEWEKLEEMNIRVITIKEEGFPSLLKNIYNPPPVLYYQGEFIKLMKEAKGLAIVGSRKASYYGRKVAREISTKLAREGYIIISGLARGIDTNAHLGALEANGSTVAVLGCGLDRIYPPENKSLAQRIIAEKGAIITEFPISTKPEKNNFPRRNRIISGLSMGILVVEATEKSGALITTDFALEQGREVFAIPGSINSYLSTGCHNLIKQGAKLVNCYQDIIDELTVESAFTTQDNKRGDKKENDRIAVDLNNFEQVLLEYISIEPLHIDELAELATIPYSKLNEVLLSLELKNLIKEVEGKRYIKI